MFVIGDALRRSLGSLFDSAGLAPQQASWRVVVDQSDLRLRRYGRQRGTAGPVLIVPAPIKRPYIFDLLPEVSVIRRLTEAGFSVYLSEWCEEVSVSGDLGKSVESLRIALEKIASEHGRAPILIGHSLGGTV